jgi:hypothetical protein
VRAARKEGGMSADERSADERSADERSSLVGVLYGLLEGAGDYEAHIRDAEMAFDQELADFLREVQREDCRRAERARKLLAGRTSMGGV